MKVDVISRGGSRRGATWVCICRRVPPARGQSAGGRTRPSGGGRRCLLETLALGFCSSLVLTQTTKYESTVVSRLSLYYYLAENMYCIRDVFSIYFFYKNLEEVPKMKILVFDNTLFLNYYVLIFLTCASDFCVAQYFRSTQMIRDRYVH